MLRIVSIVALVASAGCALTFDPQGLDQEDDAGATLPDVPGTDAGTADAGATDAQPRDAGPRDAGLVPDAGRIDPPSFLYVPSNFDPVLVVDPPALRLDCGRSIYDTHDRSMSNGCGRDVPNGRVIRLANGVEAVLLAVAGFEIAAGSSLEITGDRPLIIAALGDVRLDGAIDASARAGTPGPGGSEAAVCGEGTGGDGDGGGSVRAGGGGGGFGTAGARGGSADDGDVSSSRAGITNGDPRLVPLRGGCSGGRGNGNDDRRGAGGGALQISAAGVLSVRAVITSGGGGGAQGNGGGSGGALLLEGERIELSASAKLLALGGGGGEAGSEGAAGADASSTTVEPALGGRSGSGAPGGDGAAGRAAATDGAGGREDRAGGGGGGGLGRIRLNARSGCVRSSAELSPAPTGSGEGC